ncbi:MAG TPA: glycosyltransferase family 9 protein [Candidatus Sulfotelmatobacter sp.]|nr:glycosyltransferase family 9 protein [Candidatus Sulfotelmatobacter sp.]
MIEHIGDIVACEPVARHIRQTHADTYIVWCIGAPYRSLIESNPNVDEIIVVGCLTEWILLKASGVAGKIVDLHPRGRSCRICDVRLKKTEGDPRINNDNYYDFGNLIGAFSRSAGLSGLENAVPRVYIPSPAMKAVDALKLPSQFLIFHARTNEIERNWSDEKWAVLLERLRDEHNIFTIEIGLSAVMTSTSPLYRSLCGQTGLMELAEVIRRATMFVGADSGPAHLANAAGTPGVIMLGHFKSFQRYLPYSGGYADGTLAKLIYGDGPATSILVAQVFTAVTDIWGQAIRNPRVAQLSA